MIRPYRSDDCEVLIPLIQADKHMQPDEIRERLEGNTSWVYDDGTLKGCATVTSVRDTPRGRQLQLWLYTAPAERGKGIGRALWNTIAKYIAELDVEVVGTGYRSDRGGAPVFFSERGFSYWFASHLLGYDGPGFPETTLDVIPYHEGLFEDYVRLINEGFSELRKVNDIHPHHPFPPGFDDSSLRQELLEAQDNVFFFQHDGALIGVVTLGPNYVDDLVVAREHQRKGYGKQIMHFSINKLRARGAQKVVLGVVDSNHGARALYESMGFKLIETHSFARMRK